MTLLSLLNKFLVGYAAVVAVLFMLSRVLPAAGFFARVLSAYVALIICSIFGLLAAIVLRLTGNVGLAQYPAALSFKYVLGALIGVTFYVDDPKGILQTTRPAVFIGNHQTELDVLMLGCMWPKYCSVTAKASLKHTPFLGWFMQLSGTIFIDRKNTKDARDAMKGAADQIRQHQQSVYMFPEGTRSYAKEPILLPFKKGAFYLAVEAGVPIVPCVVANYSHILWIKGLVFRSGKIPIKVLDPIPTTGLTAADVPQLTQSTYDAMLAELVSLTAKARGRPISVPAKLPHNNVTTATTTGSETKAPS